MAKNTIAVVIAPAWPSLQSGYGIALVASVEQYSRVFDSVCFIVLQDDKSPPLPQRISGNVEYIQIKVRRRKKWLRFMTSLAGSLPAVVVPFCSRRVINQIIYNISGAIGRKSAGFVIFEDVPVSSLVFVIRQSFPHLPIIVRSHNVLANAFEPFAQEGHVLKRVAWRLEVSRMDRLERRLLQIADRFWAISDADLASYVERYHMKPHGVFGVSVDTQRYMDIGSGDLMKILFLGTADLRKGRGLQNFIRHSWGEIRTRFPSAQLLLAGRLTESYTDRSRGIKGVGFVKDEKSFLQQGAIFINPQEIGSGINLKSITAMLAGKALVSTKKGIEGVEGKVGEHFLVADGAKQLAPLVIELLENPAAALQMGQKARLLVADIYSSDHLSRSVTPLLVDLIGLARKLE